MEISFTLPLPTSKNHSHRYVTCLYDRASVAEADDDVPVAPSLPIIGICDNCEIPTDDLQIMSLGGHQVRVCGSCRARMLEDEEADA